MNQLAKPQELDLATLLADVRPVDALDRETLVSAAQAASVQDYAPDDLIVDAFAAQPVEIFVVLHGEVDLWHDPDRLNRAAQDRFTAVSVIGFSAMLTERPVGPRVVARTPARQLDGPAHAVQPDPRTHHGDRLASARSAAGARARRHRDRRPRRQTRDRPVERRTADRHRPRTFRHADHTVARAGARRSLRRT
jgi:signal-transduction protein with cAMP-binding, CBS, and nucleotidyltransferase domain